MSDPSMEGNEQEFREGEDFYMEAGCLVFTAAYHQKRGYCCGSGCRHCPYGEWPDAGKPSVTNKEQKP